MLYIHRPPHLTHHAHYLVKHESTKFYSFSQKKLRKNNSVGTSSTFHQFNKQWLQSLPTQNC